MNGEGGNDGRVLVTNVVRQNRFGVAANTAGTLLYTVILWPLAARDRLAVWLVAMLTVTMVHAWLLRRVRRHVHRAGFLAVTLSLVGGLWGFAGLMFGTRDLGSPRGAMVMVFAASVTANGVVALAGSPSLYRAFSAPILAGTAVTYAVHGTDGLQILVPVGCGILLVVFTAYNRQAHNYLAATAAAHDALRTELAHVHHAATHDHLTGLLNRAGLLTHRWEPTPLVMFIDVNGFKHINDTYGHTTGDDVLSTIADRLRTTLGPNDTVARLAGDEFLVLLPATLASLDVELLETRLHTTISDPIPTSTATVTVTASIGYAYPVTTTEPLPVVIDRADHHMYATKHLGSPVSHAIGDYA